MCSPDRKRSIANQLAVNDNEGGCSKHDPAWQQETAETHESTLLDSMVSQCLRHTRRGTKMSVWTVGRTSLCLS